MTRFALLREHDFRGLFLADTASQVGSQVLMLALPLIAASALRASPVEMGLLVMFETLPFILVGLPAGAIVDRLRKRTVMIVADWGRALLLVTVPLAWWAEALTIWQLYGVALLVGCFTVFFDVSYQSYLPFLVGREHLVQGNSALEVVRTVSQLGGPTAAGFLIQAVTAPFAMIATVFGLVWSALFLNGIRKREQPPERGPDAHLGREIVEGLKFVLGHPLLRRIAGSTGTFNLFGSMLMPMGILLLTQDLGLSEGTIGLLFAASGLGGLVGAALTGRMVARFGQGPTIWMSSLLGAPLTFVLPWTEADWRLGLFVLYEFVLGVSVVVYNVTQLSFRQAATPEPLLGRMNATMRFLVWGTMPLGGLLGGLLGEVIGVRATLLVGACGVSLAFLWVFTSPMRTMRELPVSSHTPR
ncbi:MFS transporter [Nonomuraea sp. NPDC050310]|uniref:MFS transporter n=1 Tax=unclassified Nonomuraea TaxID=2593643 RepID=UPI00340FAE46